MKALVLNELNQYPQLVEKHRVIASEEEVLVTLKASALNHRDVWITKGMYPGITTGIVLGSDGVGSYEGRDVILNPGLFWGENESFQSDSFEVLGMPRNGTFASEVFVGNDQIFPKPKHLDQFQAAALPLAGVTAYRALIKRAALRSSDKVFVSGIGGGVALLAVQYAIAMGCEVYVSSSSDKKSTRVIEMGAVGSVNYTEKDFSKKLLEMSGGIDVVIDSACGDNFAALVYACNPGARMVFYGGTRGKINGLNPQVIFWKQISILGSTMGSENDFKEMLAFVEEHKVVPVVDSVFKLDQVDEAFDRMNEGKQFGKIVFDHR